MRALLGDCVFRDLGCAATAPILGYYLTETGTYNDISFSIQGHDTRFGGLEDELVFGHKTTVPSQVSELRDVCLCKNLLDCRCRGREILKAANQTVR